MAVLEETVKVKIEFVELLQLGDPCSIIYCGWGRMVLCGRVFILTRLIEECFVVYLLQYYLCFRPMTFQQIPNSVKIRCSDKTVNWTKLK